MYKRMAKKLFFLGFILVIILFWPNLTDARSADAIAMRVIPNPEHYSSLRWYNEKVPNKSTPQLLTVDGYEAVRDGRTVYVDAANVDLAGPTLHTNIYIISYNQQAEKPTEDIFGQILANWRFNSNLEILPGNCSDNSSISCLNDSECLTLGYCTSFKAKVTRDTLRLARLNDIKSAINKYQQSYKHKHFPILSAGTYLTNRTISVWPSWQETLGEILGSSLPVDPLNQLSNCPGYNIQTCWNEQSKSFVWATELNAGTIPAGNYVFLYKTDSIGASFNICTASESGLVSGADACNAGCLPVCFLKECGADGCGGSCGNCFVGQTCVGSNCLSNCSTGPGCQTSLANATIVGGYCSTGNCYTCNIGYSWSGSACLASLCNLNGICESGLGETCSNCAADGCCGPPVCPDGFCDLICDECISCPADCMGNTGCCGICGCNTAIGENTVNCPIDCAVACTDNDGDFYISEATLVTSCGNVCGPSNNLACSGNNDCNDNDVNIYPGASETCGNGIDEDCLGGDLPCAFICTDTDSDGYGNPASAACTFAELDCNNNNSSINPGATEICDGVDNNCNSQIDEVCDLDNDDYCDRNQTFVYGSDLSATCAGTNTTNAASIASTGDCNDLNNTVNPGAAEICDGLDNNCNGQTDEGCDQDNDDYCGCGLTYVYGSNLTATCPGTNTTDAASIANTCDCNDTNPNIHPGATETCGNGIDEDCSGADLACPPVCIDNDGDGYGNPAAATCTYPGLDCDDSRNFIYPGATETCDNFDNNCNIITDEGCDDDNDNYCDQTMTFYNYPVTVCPNSNLANGSPGNDCNDSNASVYPGATEICGNGIDEDCLGGDLPCAPVCTDTDGDGYGNPASTSCTYPQLDCDNNNSNIYPGATEICGNGIDEDCSGADLACPPVCVDNDGDGYGNPASASCTYSQLDCNDNNPNIYPGAPEICGNGIDEDCSGSDLACPLPACTFNFDLPCQF